MAYTFNTLLSHPSNYGGKRQTKNIKYIVIHYTANKTDKAVNNAKAFNTHVVNASAHYFCDKTSIYQSVPDSTIAWSVGGNKYSDCATTGGGKMYGVITNSNSISIELCSDNGIIAKETIENAVALTKQLMSKYNIAYGNVYRHFDVTGKYCPGWTGWWGKNCKLWDDFKSKIKDGKKKIKASCAFYKKDNVADGKLGTFKEGNHIYWIKDMGNGWSYVCSNGKFGYVKNSCINRSGLSTYKIGQAIEDVMLRSGMVVSKSTNIKTIKKGVTFKVICKIGSWYQVRISDGTTGYMVSKKVKVK